MGYVSHEHKRYYYTFDNSLLFMRAFQDYYVFPR